MIFKNQTRPQKEDINKVKLRQMLESNGLIAPASFNSKKRILIKNKLSPGDVIMLTAAVRDLHRAYPNQFVTTLETPCPSLWENNPYASKREGVYDSVIDSEYPLIDRSNTWAYHFIHGYAQDLEAKLKMRIPVTDFKGDIYLSDFERNSPSKIEEIGIKDDFWIIVNGGKDDFTAKWLNPNFMQEVVDHFKGRITFVQTGESNHFHIPLNGVVNLIGKTNLRDFIKLTYHSVGVLCPVTFAMHCAAAVPVKTGRPKNRAAVVIAGGREPAQWEAYPHHRFLSNNGALPCCDSGGCWKSRCTKIKDSNIVKNKDLCLFPVPISVNKNVIDTHNIDGSFNVAKCINMIKPNDIIRAIESYYEGGCLSYGSCIPSDIPDLAKGFISL